jgi:hypothetical protein
VNQQCKFSVSESGLQSADEQTTYSLPCCHRQPSAIAISIVGDKTMLSAIALVPEMAKKGAAYLIAKEISPESKKTLRIKPTILQPISSDLVSHTRSKAYYSSRHPMTWGYG